ncbi:MAG TPA: TadE/TadG family type IV pilus assembly protein [Thermoleophilaceae bacterium]
MQIRSPHKVSDESGAAIVEFALMLPFVCLIFFAIIDFGRAFNYWVDTTHLASEGARLAAVDKVPAGSGGLQAYIRSKADTAELRDGGTSWIDSPLEVCVNPGPGDAVGDPIEVTVTTTYNLLPVDSLPIPGLKDIPANVQIHGSATMRREALATNVSPGCG